MSYGNFESIFQLFSKSNLYRIIGFHRPFCFLLLTYRHDILMYHTHIIVSNLLRQRCSVICFWFSKMSLNVLYLLLRHYYYRVHSLMSTVYFMSIERTLTQLNEFFNK